MANEPNSLKETASRTAGPYVHIGLSPSQAGFDIFGKNFSNVVAGPDTAGERIRIEGRVIELKDGHYWSVEFDKVDNVKDSGA